MAAEGGVAASFSRRFLLLGIIDFGPNGHGGGLGAGLGVTVGFRASRSDGVTMWHCCSIFYLGCYGWFATTCGGCGVRMEVWVSVLSRL